MFGGSTVYNSEVPDSLTIASQIAAIGANQALFEVVNMGATSIHSAQQFARLKSEIELEKGDIVVFYDGVNDVLQRIVYENREGYMFGQPKNESRLIKIIRYSQNYSSIAELMMQIMGNNIKPLSDKLTEDSILDYLQTLDDVKNYVLILMLAFITFSLHYLQNLS